ncbi:MAG: NUDIX hydrolase, partial [Bacteroidota bacterium]|nr:NUDIX hydrolase [Bacteroidota bacterium]
MNSDQEIIGKEIIHDAFFKVEKLQLLVDEQEITRFIVRNKKAAAIVIFNEQHQHVVLVKQFRAPLIGREESPYLVEIPAGVVDAGESAEESIIREALEETG